MAKTQRAVEHPFVKVPATDLIGLFDSSGALAIGGFRSVAFEIPGRWVGSAGNWKCLALLMPLDTSGRDPPTMY